MAEVVLVKEVSHISDGVAIERLAATGRERHGYHTVSDVGQVKVKIGVNIAALVLGNLK